MHKRNKEWMTGIDFEDEGSKAISEMLKVNTTLKEMSLISENK